MRLWIRWLIDAVAIALAFVCSAYAFGHWGAGWIGGFAVAFYGMWCFSDGAMP